MDPAPRRLPSRLHTTAILVCAVACLGCSETERADPRGDTAGAADDVEVVSLLGTPLVRQQLPPDVLERYTANLETARAAYEADPDDEDAIVWLGRRTAYLGRYREAVDIYTRGLELHPDSYRLLRHRGHRHITLRRFDDAIADLRRAAELMPAEPEVEPDGIPNRLDLPLTTTQFNVWYHLGLAHYLEGEWEEARRAYERCMEVSDNPDTLVATTDWLYMTLRRMGRDAEAAGLLEPIHADLEIVENDAYFRRLLMYKGELSPGDLLDLRVADATAEEAPTEATGATGAGGRAEARAPGTATPAADPDLALQMATQGYGVGNWYLYGGDAERATAIFRRILEGPSWAAFGYIAAEAELARLALSAGPAGPAAADSAAAALDEGRPTVVLVSFDGFRHDYLERFDTPAFDRLATEGVRAGALVPVFPSKTFPAHYSLVTGLHPGRHGIVSNHMRDPRWPEEFRLSDRAEVEKGRWWGGEPLWVTAERQGLVAASLFWPGSEAPVQGVRPSHWERYDGSMPHAERIARVLGWLDLPPGERPALVAVYFEEPDGAGHAHGPDSPQVERAVERMDEVLGELLDGLAARGWPDGLDVVVVSDHGMAATSPDRVIVLEDLLPPEVLPLRPGEVFEQGALLQLFPDGGVARPPPAGSAEDAGGGPGTADDRAERMYRALTGAHPALSVYRRGRTPERYRLDGHPRLPPLLGVPDVGWEVFTRDRWRDIGDALLAGDHGQDPADPRMHGIFLAAGPTFRAGTRLPEVQAVDVYLLLCAALGLDPAPNDGDASRIAPLLGHGATPRRR